MSDKWVHIKTGGIYELIGPAKMQTDDWYDLSNAYDEGGFLGGDRVDMAEVMVYRSFADGLLWVRPKAEFERKFRR